jgi:hypothetical protein
MGIGFNANREEYTAHNTAAESTVKYDPCDKCG